MKSTFDPSRFFFLGSMVALLGVTSLVHAQKPASDPFQRGRNAYLSEGGVQGGGGDTGTELTIKEIRDDILNWIIRGGAASLKFDSKLTRYEYEHGSQSKGVFGMLDVLQPGAVVVNVLTSREQDPKNVLKNTYVNGVKKICKGIFEHPADHRSYLICEKEAFENIHRDPEEKSDRQYQLIHHEYASLAGLERNLGSDSDYYLSRQLSKKLASKVERRLSIQSGGATVQNAFGMKFVKIAAKGRSIKVNRPIIVMGEPKEGTTMTTVIPLLTSFEIQTTPVTQEQWFQVMGYKPDPQRFRPDAPVTQVRYLEVCGPDVYLEGKRNEMNGHYYGMSPKAADPFVCGREKSVSFMYRLNEFKDGCRYRLPLEEEWEFVAQESQGLASDEGWSTAQPQDSSKIEPAEVAQKRPNALGVYDLFGNVGEMVFGRELIKVSDQGEVTLTTLAKGWPRWWALPAGNRWGLEERSHRFYFDLWTDRAADRDVWLGFRLVRECDSE